MFSWVTYISHVSERLRLYRAAQKAEHTVNDISSNRLAIH